MIDAAEIRAQMPSICPACQRTLYATAASRPQPSMSRAGKMLYLAAGTVSTALFFLIGFLLRSKITLWKVADIPNTDSAVYRTLPTPLIAIIALPVALLPGLAIGWLALRRKQVRRLRCWNCGWSKIFPVTAHWAPREENVAPPIPALPEFNIVDDGDTDAWKAAIAWTRGEIREGRLPEEIEADLVAQGWPRDDVEGMVERCRREARQR